MNNKIYFVGKLPLPIGGVTIFNQRKIDQLKISNDVVVIEPIFNKILFILFILFKKNDIHVSASNFLLIFFIVIFYRSSNIIFYDHNSSRHFSGASKFKKIVYYNFFLSCKDIVLVDRHLENNYKIFLDYKKFKPNFVFISAFLPPAQSELPQILASYDEKILAIYRGAILKNCRNIVITTAFKPNLDEHGNDIYTLDRTIDDFNLLATQYKNYYFFIAIASYSDTEFSNHIERKINSLKNKHENLIFLEKNKKIWPLLCVTKLFIRATTTDGDSVSLREAAYFGAPILASDVVPRPDGVNLFNLKKDNLQDTIKNLLI